jgi:hypothetical protein
VAGNPRRNALFGVVSETCGLRRLDGGGRSPAKPVSASEKRIIREKYRGNEELGPKMSLRRQENPASTQVSRPVPLQRLTGPDFGITGKLTANNRERVLNFMPAWLYCHGRSRAASGPPDRCRLARRYECRLCQAGRRHSWPRFSDDHLIAAAEAHRRASWWCETRA